MRGSSDWLLVVLILQSVACAPDEAADSPQDAATDPTDGSAEAPLVCAVPAEVSPWFVERTEEWALRELGVQGVRLSVVDIDHDGWPDLLARRGGTRVESYEPDGQRSTWLLRNTGSGFEDVTQQSGLVRLRNAPQDDTRGRPLDVPTFGDIDNDGRVDVYTGVSTADVAVTEGETSELMVGFGDGEFGLVGSDSAVRRPDEVDAVAGATFADVDLDGFLDLWVAHHNYDRGGSTVFAQDRLYLNDGTGEFTDATLQVGLQTAEWNELDDLNQALAHSRAWSAAACDLNNDLLPELLVASYGRAPNHLWRAEASGEAVSWVNESVASGYAYDASQRWQDNQFAACFCQSNPTAEGCAEAVEPAIGCDQQNWQHSTDREAFRLGGNSGATVCADLDNDGYLDLVTTEIRHWWAGSGSDGSAILRNLGDPLVRLERLERSATGMEVPHPTGQSWDEGHMTAAVFDFDNDGWQDIYLGGSDYPGNYGLLYRQVAPMQFELLDTSEYFAHNRSHGVAWADFDRDGDLDLVVGHSRARCAANEPNDCYETSQVRFFENQAAGSTNWIQLDLQGVTANRDAIGAQVRVTLPGGEVLTRHVQSGYGHYGAQNDRNVHIGLGTECEVDVEVRWPDSAGTVSTARLRGGARYRWVQGAAPEPAP